MKPVVLLVHGIFDKGTIFKTLSAYLEELGMETVYPDFTPNDGSEPLEYLAGQVRTYIDQFHASQRQIYLVGFSMGGLICRYFMQSMGGVDKVSRWVTISSPHHGTWNASLFWGKGVKQMRVGSDFLEELNKTMNVLESVPTLSIWTPYDLMILPADSSRLSLGENVTVDCLAHPLMYSDKHVLKLVGDFLKKGG